MGCLWARHVSLINSLQTPSAKMCKRFSISRAGRTASSGVIYAVPESCPSLVFFVFAVPQLLERPVTSACSHRSAYSTTVVCIGKKEWVYTVCVFVWWRRGSFSLSVQNLYGSLIHNPHVNFILCLRSFLINISDTPSLAGWVKHTLVHIFVYVAWFVGCLDDSF